MAQQTFTADDDDFEDENLDEQEHDQEDERPRFGGRRKRGDDVPDTPVENAGDLPLLVHAGTSKSNTVTYLKIVRMDGPQGVRGFKGRMDPGSTYEDVARRYGNGTYKVEGCNYRHKVLAREEGMEISIPEFEDDKSKNQLPPGMGMGFSPNAILHSMKMVSDLSTKHGETVREQSQSNSEQVREMANKTMEMLTAFTAAQRESERNSYAASAASQQQFFATMMQIQQTAHAQQMEMLTAMHERTRKSDTDPMQMVQVFLDGLKTAGELGGGAGGDTEPWVAALKEGTGMLGHLASLAHAPAVQRSLPGASQAPRALPSPTNTEPNPTKRKKRLPFKKDEIRGLARLRAELRKRGIPFDVFLSQTTDFYQKAADSELFEDDAPVGSEDDAAHESEEGPEDPTTP